MVSTHSRAQEALFQGTAFTGIIPRFIQQQQEAPIEEYKLRIILWKLLRQQFQKGPNKLNELHVTTKLLKKFMKSIKGIQMRLLNRRRVETGDQ